MQKKRQGITRRALLECAGSTAMAGIASASAGWSSRSTALSPSVTGGPAGGSKQKLLTSLRFVDIPTTTIPENITEFQTVGFGIPNLGMGTYRCDEIANAIGGKFPRCCARSKNGRFFRLMPGNDCITVEQAGAEGDRWLDGSTNDRPAFQAAIDYARAIALETILLTLPVYAIWMTWRTTPVSEWGVDGNGLVVQSDQRVRLLGVCTDRSLIRFRGPQGESLADPAAVQPLQSGPWRGSGFVLCTHPTLSISSLSLQHLRIETDYRRNLNSTADDLSWDVTNKGILSQPDKLGGDISIVDCSLVGWRGETVYCNNDRQRMLYVRNSAFSDSNGQGLNPNSLKVDVFDCKISNCYLGIEGWTGEAGGRIHAVIENCGSAMSLQGGMYGRSPRSNYYAPTRISAVDPIGEIDITCINSGAIYLGWWLKGTLKAVDSSVVIGDGGAFGEGSQWLDLDIAFQTLRPDLAATHMWIAPGVGSAGDQLTNNLNLRLSVLDVSPVRVLCYGSLGPNIFLHFGSSAQYLSIEAAAALTDYQPNLV